MKAYRVRGTTNDVTDCELCGRVELRGTVVMQPLDADGNDDGDVAYFGTSCAAKAAGWTQREVKEGVRAVERAKREAADAQRKAERQEWESHRTEVLLREFGTTDGDELWRIARSRGMGAPRLLASVGL